MRGLVMRESWEGKRERGRGGIIADDCFAGRERGFFGRKRGGRDWRVFGKNYRVKSVGAGQPEGSADRCAGLVKFLPRFL